MTRLELRVVAAAWLAAAVVIGAVVCAAYDWSIVSSVLAIFALGVGAWLYHSIERLILARRISTVRQAAKPLQPLVPVMGAIIGLMQAVVRSLGDVSELPGRNWEFPQLPLLRWVENPLGIRGNRQQIIEGDQQSDAESDAGKLAS
ncbi:antitermination protein NusB [Mycobacterium intermedium]|uniref:Antitermination protein NusB n=1 Tax=Mycobacterium intermedium TaxID=28445 RepID=A0A1E3SHY1_MYCIE|nr:antitermination protein NusB [Mycobacterium intermedium]MCV6964926.1 antitermination protein NusB [Mycobacterium intermedium]ODR01692.1 antitermination protein NusB [Mycobacterium intermedium]OPE52213.1 antitermination protein NusB [Mycobacterium intermedium]ORA98828.1 antitermination protein NusB [Mycobacterium intermedium]